MGILHLDSKRLCVRNLFYFISISCRDIHLTNKKWPTLTKPKLSKKLPLRLPRKRLPKKSLLRKPPKKLPKKKRPRRPPMVTPKNQKTVTKTVMPKMARKPKPLMVILKTDTKTAMPKMAILRTESIRTVIPKMATKTAKMPKMAKLKPPKPKKMAMMPKIRKLLNVRPKKTNPNLFQFRQKKLQN